jgi:hypothetical protein
VPDLDEDRVRRLANALAVHARKVWTGGIEEGWRVLTRDAFADAGIPLTPDEFERAWHATWQSAFFGGNFTLDARRILRAAMQHP